MSFVICDDCEKVWKTIKVVGYGKSSCYHFLYAADRDTTRASNQCYYVKHGAGCDMGKVGGSKKNKEGDFNFLPCDFM